MLRLRSRLEFVPKMETESRYPLVLISALPIVKLFLQHAHQIFMHQGQEFVKSFVQQRCQTIGIRQALRSIAHHSLLYRQYKADSFQLIMAALPLRRYTNENHHFLFTNTGPFYIENKTDIEKPYESNLTCFPTRAGHFENCPNLTTDSLLNAIGRL